MLVDLLYILLTEMLFHLLFLLSNWTCVSLFNFDGSLYFVNTSPFYGFMISKYFFLLLFNYSCPHFPPSTLPYCTHPTSHTQSFPPLSLSWVLYTCSVLPRPLLSLLSPPSFPPVTLSSFFISKSLVIFCLLVCLLIRFQF